VGCKVGVKLIGKPPTSSAQVLDYDNGLVLSGQKAQGHGGRGVNWESDEYLAFGSGSRKNAH